MPSGKILLKYLLTVVAIGSFYGVSSAIPSTPASSEWMRKGRETGDARAQAQECRSICQGCWRRFRCREGQSAGFRRHLYQVPWSA